eukprot:5867383-Ditylum_brightwellii.AAC.1
MMIMSKLHNLHTRSINFVLAYPQAEVKLVIYLHPPIGIILNTNGEDVVFKLRKNLYGLNDTGRTWWEHMSEGPEKIEFKQCNADQFVWIKDGIMVVVCVDDCLIFGNKEREIEKLEQDLKSRFDITDEGKTIEKYLGVKIDHNSDGSFRMYQPHLLKRIIKTIPEMEKATGHK